MKSMKKSDEGRRVRAWITNPDTNCAKGDEVLEIVGNVCSVLSAQFTMDTVDGGHHFVMYNQKWNFDG